MSKKKHKVDFKKEQLPLAVHQWALEVMQLKECPVPSQEDLKMLFRDANHSALWGYLVTCILPTTSAVLCKQNLQLHFGSHDHKKVELHTKKLAVGTELNSLNLAVTHMEADIVRLQNDITVLARENDLLDCEITKARWRESLLEASQNKMQEDEGLLREYVNRIAQRKSIFGSPKHEVSYFAQYGGRGGDPQNLVLESACKRDVKKLCELVKGLLEVREGQTSAVSLERTKVEVWSAVESLLSVHSGSDLLECVNEVVDDEAADIYSLTSSLDLIKDAASLRYDQSKQDGERGLSFLQSVEDHLLELQLGHIRRSLECRRWQTCSKSAYLLLEEVKGQIVALLWKQLPSEDDQAKRDLVMSCVLQGLEVSGSEAVMATFSQLCAELDCTREERKQALEALQTKKERIDLFAQVAERRQTDIKQLVRLNSGARARLQRQRSEVELYVQRSVCGHEVQLLGLGEWLMHSGHKEVQGFSLLELSRLLKTPTLNTAVCELSIHRFRPHQPAGFPGWEGILDILGLPTHTSPHTFLTGVTTRLHRVASLSQELEKQEQLILSIKQHFLKYEDCRAVLEASRSYDEHLLSGEADRVTKSMSLASRALAQSSMVEHVLHEWWSEPAQWTTPWVLYEDMPLTKWLEQWKILTAKLRQLSNVQS